MKIAVIGANGKTGIEVVRRALACGHNVKGGYYGAAPAVQNPLLELQRCDATNKSDVVRLLDGVDAVVLALGHTKNTPPTMQADATKIILQVMAEKNIWRIVSLTGVGVEVRGDSPRLFERLFNKLFAKLQATRVKDGEAHHALISQSDRKWTVFRAFKLTNGETQPWELKPTVPGMLLTSRKTVAEAMIHVIERDLALSQSPVFVKKTDS